MAKYRAFISYAHADERWARWLMRRLETYRVPPHLVGTRGSDGAIGQRLGAFFRDRDELSAAGDLGATIRTALEQADALIVICSPSSAASRWVNAEIEAFRASGRGDWVMCFVVAGDPGATSGDGCFPPALLVPGTDGRPIEPLAADARREGDGRERAFLKLVAGLLGVSFDALAQREAQRRHRRLIAVAAAALAGMAIALGLAATAWVARNDAQRRQAQAEDLLGFMLGDLREKLTTVGRLDLMNAVHDQATAYFATLQPRDLTDRALEEQARALTGIGQVRLGEGNHVEASEAFREAHARTLALHERAPGDGQRLFDLAQAQFWIGLVALNQGRFGETADWFGRYRDSALKLTAIDPDNFGWQREVAYAFHNLAVVDDRQGRYAEAESALNEEMALYRRWIEQHPDDLEVRYEAANVASWLGSIAARQGRLGEAEALQSEAVEAYAHNVEREPDNARWKDLLTLALALEAEIRAQRGRYAAARESVARAAELLEKLAELDPSNFSWQLGLGKVRWWQAMLSEDARHPSTAALAAQSESILAASHTAEPRDEYAMRWLVRARSLLAELALLRGDAGEAQAWLARSHAVLDPAWEQLQNEPLRIALAEVLVLDGEAARLAGDAAAAERAWQRVESLLTTGSEPPLPFERLDPLVRSLRHRGLAERAAPFERRLSEAGHIGLRLLPAAVATSASH